MSIYGSTTGSKWAYRAFHLTRNIDQHIMHIWHTLIDMRTRLHTRENLLMVPSPSRYSSPLKILAATSRDVPSGPPTSSLRAPWTRSCIALALSASLASLFSMSCTETALHVRSVTSYCLSKWQINHHFNIYNHTSCDPVYHVFKI